MAVGDGEDGDAAVEGREYVPPRVAVALARRHPAEVGACHVRVHVEQAGLLGVGVRVRDRVSMSVLVLVLVLGLGFGLG